MTEDRPKDERSNAGDDERPRLKVTDRRLFDREGNLRDRSGAEDDATAAAPAAPSVATPTDDQDTAPGGRIVEPSQVSPPTEAVRPSEDSLPATDPETSAPGADARPDDGPGTPETGPEAGGKRIITPRPSPADLPRDFAAFVESMYFEALLFLGAVRHPQTGQTLEDLEMARYKIDLLSMLQDKTEGNLESEESRLLEDALYQLRMLYLEKSESGQSVG